EVMLTCLNRKGVFVTLNPSGDVEITTNLRAILKWDKFNCAANQTPIVFQVYDILRAVGHELAPRIIKAPNTDSWGGPLYETYYLKTEGLTDDQAFCTLWLYGSRGFSHEMVRHRENMSQRSTRYVDEDGSPYIEHPLITKYL